jgi:acyl-CoA reductase-like NAD-dependent aldehyde dehydrogenase
VSLFHEDRLLIDGELVPAPRDFETVDPSTEKALGTASDADVGHVEAAVTAARRVFDSTDWMRDRDLRLRCLRQFYDALREHREELRELTIAEVGAPLSLNYGPQLDEPVEMVRYCADLLERYTFRAELGTAESRGRHHRRWVEKEAAGVVAERALAAGARLVAGGRPAERGGLFYEPTLLADADPGTEIAQEEAFGPAPAVIAYDDEDGAVRIANGSVYELSGAVMGADDERATAVTRRIRSGIFSINGGKYFAADAPFGRFKQPGIGRETGVAGLEEFLELKTFAVPVG